MPVIIALCTLLAVYKPLQAQDTIRVHFDAFVERAIEHSAQLEARQKQVALAENRIREAQSLRVLPNLNLTTAHGFVPGVKSRNPDLSPGQYYLDPDLENDWEDWAFFTQAEISGLQPIYTWGAISNAIKAARSGADVARHEFHVQKESFKIQLFELYQSAILVKELERLVSDAKSQLNQAERELEKMREEGDPSLEEKDVFEFYIYKEEFLALELEVQQTALFVQRAWNVVLSAGRDELFLPKESFLDPVPVHIQDITFYQSSAINNRHELRGLSAAQEAARYGVSIARSQYYPSMFMGLSAGIGYTPNRPRQTNPFIRNSTNFQSVRAGIGFQQNLNFLQIRSNVQRSEIQLRQLRDYEDAAKDGIMLEIHDAYMDAKIAEARRSSKNNALRISNEWLRTEQIDFDIGFGDIKNLVDAVKKKMELEFEVTQLTYDYNLKLANLYHQAGLKLQELITTATNKD
ncbi:TolC family protein [Balneolaceae bacterium ANBcel3]|nr:TolC family protein [Balneolaceae bacterium ANBcel3]